MKDANLPDATERIVSVIKDIAEALKENNKVPIEISTKLKKFKRWKRKKRKRKKKKIMKEYKKKRQIIQQAIAEESEVIKKPLSQDEIQ